MNSINAQAQALQDAKHTQEPWQCGQVFTSKIGGYDWQNVYSIDERHIARVICDETRAENAARIVACVNACAGMKHPAEEIAALRKLGFRADNCDDGAFRLFMESIRVELADMGFDNPHQDINGRDCCEYLGNLYNDIREALEHAPAQEPDVQPTREPDVGTDFRRILATAGDTPVDKILRSKGLRKAIEAELRALGMDPNKP